MHSRLSRLVLAGAFAGAALCGAAVPAGAVGAGPTLKQIRIRLAHTVEVQNPGEHFVRLGRPLTIQDGRGTGTLTAVVGGRRPTADGAGQLVFFWFNRRFIGVSSSYETAHVVSLRSFAPGSFVIGYTRYRRSDAWCCPSLPPRLVSYGWSGRMLISNGVPPHSSEMPFTVRYRP